ncbi:MAG: Ser-Thr-rich GPI-anchored membrane family protein [Candidatus Helarchaeota archaeon]
MSYPLQKLYKNSNLVSVITSSTSNDGSLRWSIPHGISQGSYYRIKITSTTDSSIYDYSDYFTIYTNNPTHMPIPGFTILLSTLGFTLSLLFRNRFKTKKPI